MKDSRLNFNQNNIVMVTGIGPGAGATTVAITLAEFFKKKGEKTGYLQLPKGERKVENLDPYYMLTMDRESNWNSFYRLTTEGKSTKTTCNMNYAINWAVGLPGDRDLCLKVAETQRLMYGVPCQTLVVDGGAEPTDENLLMADLIVAVIDPLPSKVLQNLEAVKRLKQLEYEGQKVVWIVNKMNKGVDLGQIVKNLKLTMHFELEFLPAEVLYGSQFKGQALVENGKLLDAFTPTFERIIKEALK